MSQFQGGNGQGQQWGNQGQQGWGNQPPQGQQGNFNNQGGGPPQNAGGPPLPPWAQAIMQGVSQGMVPYLNVVTMYGQIAPSKQMPNGFMVQSGQNNKPGPLAINVKLRNSYTANGQLVVKESSIRVVAFGQYGQQLAQRIGVGAIIAFKGEFRMNTYKNKQGQLVSFPQIILNSRDPEAFFVVGRLPYIDERTQYGGNQGGGQQNWGNQQQGQTQGQQNWGQQPPQGQPTQGGYAGAQPQQNWGAAAPANQTPVQGPPQGQQGWAQQPHQGQPPQQNWGQQPQGQPLATQGPPQGWNQSAQAGPGPSNNPAPLNNGGAGGPVGEDDIPFELAPQSGR